jgi:hypothetical protein
MTLVLVLTAIGLGQVIGWALYWFFRRNTSFAVLLGRSSARKLSLGAAASRSPFDDHLTDFRREFDRVIAEMEGDES